MGLFNYQEARLDAYFKKTAGAPAQFDCTKYWTTLGDLHGNALKLLNVLHLSDIVNIDEDAYNAAFYSYEGAETYTWADRQSAFTQFYAEVLPKIGVTQGALFRCIGDVLADRGANDIYTLEIIVRLIDLGAQVEIIASNHDREFIRWMEAILRDETPPSHTMSDMFVASHIRLIELCRKGLVSKTHLTELYEKYKRTLKPLSYDYDSDGKLLLYSHAHLDERDVLAMATGLLAAAQVPDLIKQRMSDLCERLNNSDAAISEEDTILLVEFTNAIFRDYAEKNRLSELFDLNANRMSSGQPHIDPEINPIFYALWNRENIDARPQTRPKNPNITNVHGHHTYPNGQKQAICIDNVFGKFAGDYVGGLSLVASHPADIPQSALQELRDKTLATSRAAQIIALKDWLKTNSNVVQNTSGLQVVQSRDAVVLAMSRMVASINLKDFESWEKGEFTTSDQINQKWAEMDTALMGASNPTTMQKVKRAFDAAIIARTANTPKGTTDALLTQWQAGRAGNVAAVPARSLTSTGPTQHH